MLLLAALVSTAAWSWGFAQEIPVQSRLSITKSKGSVRVECRFNDISGDFDGATIHWYQQKTNKAPERILYLAGTKVVDEGFQERRYRVEKFSSQKVCILTINDVTPDDTATYYCAYWYDHCYYSKVFGSGTKLIVSDKGQSQPSNFEILQKKHKNQMMYVCLIEKFYPEVIRVTWTEGENQKVTENIVKGEAWRPTEEDKYSISSWLTVPEENKDKKYFCNYEHESGKGSRANEDSSQKEECIPYPGNSTVVFNRDHLYHRTAYLVYIVLLLKSSMYYLIVLFFIYRAWAPTKHQRKKA
ncbi:immunoglobulin kappa light chain-like isoform X2 [Rissa tridactyla]|uniref:immunoglobulin kappa light chain-like isoform X2 n=1 Tax=Rissa tridactyla TaxID=75485 RepID=UPI0023BA6603|nr:immunoglobulin kappa light chain-like isoform X2 [Rissa tridactyla]